MYKIHQNPDLLFGNVQIQLCKLEPLESGNDSVVIKLCGSDSSSEQDGTTISTTRRKNQPHGLVSLSEYVENCCSKISNKLMNKVHRRVFALCYFVKDDVYNCLSVCMKS